eukprot:PhM_4_TR17410/c0_g1_i1/m.29477/K01689/ENO, eno; enolase
MTSARMPPPDYVKKFRLTELLDEAANECYLAQSQDPCGFFVNHFTLRGGMNVIDNISCREVLDPTGVPTVEVDVVANGRVQSSVAASQCTVIQHPCPTCLAVSQRDGDDNRHNGMGMRNAVDLVHKFVSPKLLGMQLRQTECDRELRAIDGTRNNAKLGTHVVSAVSASVAVAAGSVANRPAFYPMAEEFHSGVGIPRRFYLPTPVVSVMTPPVNAMGRVRVRDVVIVPNPHEYVKVADALNNCGKVVRALGKLLVQKFGDGTDAIGVDGSYTFAGYESLEQMILLVEEAIKEAGLALGRVMQIGLFFDGDLIYNKETQKYQLAEGLELIGPHLTETVVKLVAEHPAIAYLEDVHASTDHVEYKRLSAKLGNQCTIVGGRVYSTLTELAQKGAEEVQSTACMVRLNDVGTVTEVFECARAFLSLPNSSLAVCADVQEAAPTFLADMAVAMGARYLRAGGLMRGERVAVYNRLLVLQEYLEKNEIFSQPPALDAIELPAPPPDTAPAMDAAPEKGKPDKGKKK